MIAVCGNCKEQKPEVAFYKNPRKVNGLESHCKQCVLARKAKKYKVTSKVKKKNKYLRLCRKVKVLDVQQCTFEEVLINRPSEDLMANELKELVDGVLCYQNMQRSRELVMVG